MYHPSVAGRNPVSTDRLEPALSSRLMATSMATNCEKVEAWKVMVFASRSWDMNPVGSKWSLTGSYT